jgi:hypothetical protein
MAAPEVTVDDSHCGSKDWAPVDANIFSIPYTDENPKRGTVTKQSLNAGRDVNGAARMKMKLVE